MKRINAVLLFILTSFLGVILPELIPTIPDQNKPILWIISIIVAGIVCFLIYKTTDPGEPQPKVEQQEALVVDIVHISQAAEAEIYKTVDNLKRYSDEISHLSSQAGKVSNEQIAERAKHWISKSEHEIDQATTNIRGLNRQIREFVGTMTRQARDLDRSLDRHRIDHSQAQSFISDQQKARQQIAQNVASLRTSSNSMKRAFDDGKISRELDVAAKSFASELDDLATLGTTIIALIDRVITAASRHL